MTFGKPLNLFNMGRCGTLKLIWFKNKKFMNMSWNTIFYFAIVNRVKINAHTIFWIYACCNLSTVYDRGGEFLYGLFSTFPFFPFPFLPSLPFLSFFLSFSLSFLSFSPPLPLERGLSQSHWTHSRWRRSFLLLFLFSRCPLFAHGTVRPVLKVPRKKKV